LLTGNASVAAHLPISWRRNGRLPAPQAIELTGVEGPAAVLAGSVAQQTVEQLEYFGQKNEIVAIDLTRVLEGDDVGSSALVAANRAIKAGHAIAIATTAPQDEVEHLQRI